MSLFSHLACPLDGDPLTRNQQTLVCPAGHSFDIARQGYANLLPVQHKNSRAPGDSKEMVEARRVFLDSGSYAPIAALLAERALAALPGDMPACVLDAGSGEGYYLDQVYQQLQAAGRHEQVDLIGMDIAKPAVMAACRRNRQITWLVASNVRPPLLSASVDLLLCLFGFPSYDAFSRVLKPGGRLLLVDPGPDHLIELREIIYPEVRRSAPPALDKAEAVGFSLADEQSLRFQTGRLNREQLDQLLVMTPHLYRASAAGKAAALALESLDLTVDVTFRELLLS